MKFLIIALLFYKILMVFTSTTSWFIPNVNNFLVGIYSPIEQGTYPVLVFVTGFRARAAVSSYSDLLTKIAEQSVIVIGVGSIANTTQSYVEEQFTDFMTFITDPVNGAKKLFEDNPSTTNVIPNLENQLGFLCHSAGCQTTTGYLTKRCGTSNAQVKLSIMMSPVDGTNPFGPPFGPGFITNPPNLLPFNTSVLIISDGLDNIPLPPFTLACGPDAISNDRFFRSLSGPTWLLNFTEFGHVDMLDDSTRNASSALCVTCSFLNSNGCNYEQFRQDEANAIAWFTEGILNFGQGRRKLRFLRNPDRYFVSQATIKSNVQRVRNSNGFCENFSLLL